MTSILSRNHNATASVDQERTGWTFGRVMRVATGSVLALVSLGLIVAGGYLLSEATSDDGWLDLGHGDYATDSYAVITEPEDWGDQTYLLDGVEKVRIRITPADDATPVFVGMARPDDVERYLSGVQHVTVHGADNYSVTYTQHDGQAPASPPVDAAPWTVQTTGTGPQTLEFDASEHAGDQVLVVMNADGSPSVNGKAESLVTQPSLVWIATGLLVGGVALGAGTLLLFVQRLRRLIGQH